ncbi:ribonuclease Z, mitochondrial-like [Trichogramma pretiosum]|uniref:ribonuclease Z, mitochondrial-like n=1 Tax=Trichogramma pretiosum TaxID=7493 RepID=UPI0006C93E83|nr:ribonuclease Z, mitochondrial-like [Trichogramma pretiosum]XP_023313576.1 ribonuclease Z, mitochondrial-like [Trichogramma pretiosum]
MDLKQQRKRKAPAVKIAPSQIYLQVIGNGSQAENRSLLLVTDHTSYLFNCGEGTQRLATEYKAKLTKIEHVFVTKPSWNNIGGLLGFYLTIQDTGVPEITMHGSDGLSDIVKATKDFVNLNPLKVNFSNKEHPFEDQTMCVSYIEIKSPVSEIDTINDTLCESEDDGPIATINYYEYEENMCGKKSVRSNIPSQESSNHNESLKQRIDTVITFVCKIHPKVGSLNKEKCDAKGVPSGPILGKLKKGEDVTLPDGTIVRSIDVVSPSEPGPLFIVTECPNENWIDNFVQNSAFFKYQQATASKKEEVASYVIHFSPNSVINHPKYKEWMHKFGPTTEHLIINEGNQDYASEAMYKLQHQLHLVHPSIFPFSSNQPLLQQENVENEIKSDLTIRKMKTLNTIHLRPFSGFKSTEVEIDKNKYLEEVFSIEGFESSLEKMKIEIQAETGLLKPNNEYPKLLMLGTGSSIPNKVRNTSGMILRLNKNCSIILDCGEGTAGQIIRFFGNEKAGIIFKSIKAIYVSHLHADHHIGLIGILKQRERFTKERLFLVAPEEIKFYLKLYDRRFEPILNSFRLISNNELLHDNPLKLDLPIVNELYEALGLSNMKTCKVKHCPSAYGVAITTKDGLKISYSGDTRPWEEFIKLSKNSNLLIHEATMEDGLEQEAKIKRHSTMSEAVNVGVQAEADFILLTHFSQRYSKIPMLPEADIDFSRIGIAFDFMYVNWSQLKLLPIIYPCIELMFGEFRQMLEERAVKRELKRNEMESENL